ncbi:MAG: hypothetical protein AAF646_02935 [Pseudomonadota bacterium]
MALCTYEVAVLRHVDDPKDNDGIKTGAAFWAAIEALSVGGYISGGRLTQKGREALGVEATPT